MNKPEKCVTIYANISITDEILELFARVGVKFYTQFPRIVGVGEATGPRLDSHVWPGANTCFQVVADGDAASRLMDALSELRESETGRRSGVFAFQTSIERATF